VRTAIQLYSLRTVEEPLPALIEAVEGYDGVEFAYRLPDADREAVAAALDRAGVTAAGAHVPIEQLDDLDPYRALGCDTLVVPYLDESHFESREAVERTATRLTDAAERLVDRGFAFGYHDHTHEFVPLEDGTAYGALAAATPTSVDLQLDVGHAALAGEDPVALIERYADRIEQVHLKDCDLDGKTSTALGEGDVDIAGCIDAALDAGVEWGIVEFEDSDDPLVTAERSREALDSLL
jgi:sugar phosphate isomerase/epimerase